MPRREFVDSRDLATLTKAVNDQCSKHGIESPQARENVAIRVIQLFQDGVIEPDGIAAYLDGGRQSGSV